MDGFAMVNELPQALCQGVVHRLCDRGCWRNPRGRFHRSLARCPTRRRPWLPRGQSTENDGPDPQISRLGPVCVWRKAVCIPQKEWRPAFGLYGRLHVLSVFLCSVQPDRLTSPQQATAVWTDLYR